MAVAAVPDSVKAPCVPAELRPRFVVALGRREGGSRTALFAIQDAASPLICEEGP